MLSLLLPHACPGTLDEQGRSLLHYAVKSREVEVVKAVLDWARDYVLKAPMFDQDKCLISKNYDSEF